MDQDLEPVDDARSPCRRGGEQLRRCGSIDQIHHKMSFVEGIVIEAERL